MPFVEPYKKVRDVVRFLRDALERREGDARPTTRSRCRASGSACAPSSSRRSWSPPCARACCAWPAARPTARSSTGCRPTTCAKVAGVVHEAAGGDDKEIVCRIFVCPSENADAVRAGGRVRHRRLPERAGVRRVPRVARSRRRSCRPMWDAWKAGDRKAALAAIPDSVVDELIVHGSPSACRAADPALLRQRRDHDVAGDPAARPRPRRTGTPSGRWRRAPDVRPRFRPR